MEQRRRGQRLPTVPLSVVTVGTLLCTGAAARSERTASTGAWRESSDDTGREARRARLKAVMVCAPRLGRSARQNAKKPPPLSENSVSFHIWRALRSLPKRNARKNFGSAWRPRTPGSTTVADGGARGTARWCESPGRCLTSRLHDATRQFLADAPGHSWRSGRRLCGYLHGHRATARIPTTARAAPSRHCCW